MTGMRLRLERQFLAGYCLWNSVLRGQSGQRVFPGGVTGGGRPVPVLGPREHRMTGPDNPVGIRFARRRHFLR